MRVATSRASSRDVAVPLAGCVMFRSDSSAAEPLAIFGQVDRVRRRPEDPHAGVLQRERELERRLAAELHQARHVAAGRAFGFDHRHHVFERQRLEVQPVGRVVVGRHRLRVAVDHHRLEVFLAQRERRVAAAVVELDALADPVGAAAENDDLVARVRIRLAGRLVRAVEIRRERFELRRAGIDPLVDRLEVRATRACRGRPLPSRPAASAELGVAETGALQPCACAGPSRPSRPRCGGRRLHVANLGELLEEPRIDLRDRRGSARRSSRG